MSGRTTPSGIRPPSSGGFGTPGTPSARGPASRQSYQPSSHQAQAHEEHGSPVASTSSTHASPQSAASSTSVKVGTSSQRPASANQSHMFSRREHLLTLDTRYSPTHQATAIAGSSIVDSAALPAVCRSSRPGKRYSACSRV
jgi:hypothetical protein